MLSKKEALFRLTNTAVEIGAYDTEGGIRRLYEKYPSSSIEELAKLLVEHEFGLKDVQWFHTDWDWFTCEYSGKFYAYFKAVIPDFNNEQPVYIAFAGYYSDSDSEWDHIYPSSIYTQAEWEQARQNAIDEMQIDSCLATYLTVS